MKQHILFVCRYNRFRSVFAEAFFNKYNKNPSLVARSAAPIQGSALSPKVKQLAKELSVRIKKRSDGLSTKTMKWQNVTVIVADDVSPALFDRNKEYGKEVICWNIADVKTNSIEEMRTIAKKIEKKVLAFVKERAK